MFRDVVVYKKYPMGRSKNHLKLKVKGEGVGLVTAILFNCEEDIEKINKDDKVDLVGNININEWKGNVEVQFLIKEWRFSKN
jgi:hypothetical protein